MIKSLNGYVRYHNTMQIYRFFVNRLLFVKKICSNPFNQCYLRRQCETIFEYSPTLNACVAVR